MLDVDTANLTITVEAGVKFRDVQARLATEERPMLSALWRTSRPRPASLSARTGHTAAASSPLIRPSAKGPRIGGIVAANSTGPRRLLYGLPRDLVLGSSFCDPHWRHRRRWRQDRQERFRLDMSKLMIGSLGSLGILCEMTLRLLPLARKDGDVRLLL